MAIIEQKKNFYPVVITLVEVHELAAICEALQFTLMNWTTNVYTEQQRELFNNLRKYRQMA